MVLRHEVAVLSNDPIRRRPADGGAGRARSAEAEFGDVLATELRVLGADHPDTLATRRQIALEMAARGDQVEGNQEAR